MTQGTLVQERFNTGIWDNKWFRVAIQALLVVVFSALTAFAKKAHPSLGIPSSSAPFWLSAMVLSRCTMKWDGAGFLVGVGTALWGMPIGLEHSFAQNLASYAIAGGVLDIMTRIPGINIRKWWGAIICGLMANMAQFSIIIYSALSSPVTKHFQIVGMLNSTLLHIGFGIVAGLMGWIVFRGVQVEYQRISRRE
jgi:hypothetical protein